MKSLYFTLGIRTVSAQKIRQLIRGNGEKERKDLVPREVLAKKPTALTGHVCLGRRVLSVEMRARTQLPLGELWQGTYPSPQVPGVVFVPAAQWGSSR